ncbi:LPS export ABC transporter permease LptF [Alisedimentitalea sp. MJ-SS2]|uniref:LPS export ABC transporter permease LptF n=1 Tax=Aliisedimentitalea sp. MJ-SS2 TaxID=3049795 RepID=UPI00290E693E|nr:LPS export ABC transporter permease LptF [Alisedimentitalea sp. MJ-SS2]MDU8926563.1 LPS export ABC transporter permease LptF [Alisedimentitalea sp. MJ-SS2]
MARFDRYILSQLLVLFGFFSLVLVLVYWINRAVKLFDALIGDGQTAFVFAEFTALLLPGVIQMVLPVAGFAAAVYVTNRLSSESELTVMQATGFSPWRLARPVLVFGLIVALMLSVLAHYLVPASLSQFAERRIEVSRNITAKLLTEGTFLHPSEGVTFYIREITPEGALEDVFLSDRRDPGESQIHTATTAYVVRDGETSKLVMVDGLSQTFVRKSGRLFTTHFSDFSYDISSLIDPGAASVYHETHAFTRELINDPQGIAVRAKATAPGAIAEILHQRFSQPLFSIAAALIGFAMLLVGGFSRFGVWRQIVAAVIVLVLLKLIEGMVTEPVRANPDLWPMIYLPALLGLGVASTLLAWSGRSRQSKGPRRSPQMAGGVT